MLNTCLELAVDLISDSHHPVARIIKDIGAGAVFVASVNAIIVGYLLFSKHLPLLLESGILRIRQSSWHIAFICMILILAIVVMVKALFHKGTPLRGGMPSGHSAMAFSMWTIISIITSNGLIAVLTFVMAFLIARGRLRESVHSLWEIIAGAILGILVTLIVFQLLM